MARMRRPAPRRGQALVIFALSVTTLMLLVGLSIDGLRVYIAYAQADRAAEAAALAGAVYLPQYPTAATPAPDGNNATTRALQEAAKNGFTNSAAITVTPENGAVPTLRVAIHLSIGLSLVAVMNPAPVTTDAVAAAEVLPPITLGLGTNSFGDQPEGVTQQIASLTSPNELKQRGDPYTTNCELGWSEASDSAHADASSNIYTTSQLGIATNQPQYPTGPNCSPSTPGNPDYVPTGFGGLATRTGPTPNGASYLITLPAAGTGYSVWVWSPRFIYRGNSSANSQLFPQENIYTTGYTDNPSFYPRYAYSLFNAPELYNRAADTLKAAIWPNTTDPKTAPDPALPAGQVVKLPPLDASSSDLAIHGCAQSGAWNLSGGSTYSGAIVVGAGCVSAIPSDVGNWVQVGVATLSAPQNSPGYFRLTVDNSAGYARQNYAVKVCQNATSAPNCAGGNATIGAWNAESVLLQGTQPQTYPLANIPAAYAGRQVSVALFNPGAGTGTITLAITPPSSGGAVTYPSYVRFATGTTSPAILTSNSGDNLYHSKWIRLTVTLPPDYAGGQWKFAMTASGSAPTTIMTVAVTLLGKPVVLVPTT